MVSSAVAERGACRTTQDRSAAQASAVSASELNQAELATLAPANKIQEVQRVHKLEVKALPVAGGSLNGSDTLYELSRA